jgi:hypothetical protein
MQAIFLFGRGLFPNGIPCPARASEIRQFNFKLHQNELANALVAICSSSPMKNAPLHFIAVE